MAISFEGRLLYGAPLGRHDQEIAFFKFFHRYERAYLLGLLHFKHIHNSLPSCLAPGLRDIVDLQPQDASLVGKEEDMFVRRRDKEMLDEIFFFHVRARDALAAPALFFICGDRQALDIAGVAYSYYDILFGNKVFDREVFHFTNDIGKPLVSVFLFYFQHLFFHYLIDLLFAF